MMYEFQGLGQASGARVPASLVSVTFDGKDLEEEIEGFRILQIFGREMLGEEISSQEVGNRDGVMIVGQRKPERYLRFVYELESENEEELQQKFNLLNVLLRSNYGEDIPIVAGDEPGATFYGRYKEADEVPPDRLTVVSSFTFLCADAYKYVKEPSVEGTGAKVLTQAGRFPVNPSKIAITLASATNKVKVNNYMTGRKIVLNGNYGANDVIEIEIAKKRISVNGENRMQDLDFVESDFRKFEVVSGDRVGVVPESPYRFEIESRWI